MIVKRLQLPLQNTPPINHNHRPIQMTPSPTTQKHHHPRNILRSPQPSIRRLLLQRLQPARHLDQPAGHLGGEEARGDGVAEDVAGAEFKREILRQMVRGGFGGRVAEGRVVAERTDAQAGDGAGDDDSRGGVAGCLGG